MATLANHVAAAFVGARFGEYLSPALLDAVVGVSMLAMRLWMLKPDTPDDGQTAVRQKGLL